MGSYNLKVYEYATGIQLRMYNQTLIYSEKNQSVPLIGLIDEADKKVHTCELVRGKSTGKAKTFIVLAFHVLAWSKCTISNSSEDLEIVHFAISCIFAIIF